MKNAYASLLIYSRTKISEGEIQQIGELLELKFRKFEVVLVGQNLLEGLGPSTSFNFPLTSVSTFRNSTRNKSILAGLSRCVGDFVLFWDLELSALNSDILEMLISASDKGVELVRVKVSRSIPSRLLYRLLNIIGVTSSPYSRFYGGLVSRRLLSQVLSASITGAELDLVLANTNLRSETVEPQNLYPPREKMSERIRRIGSFIAKGTRFGSLLPLLIAFFSSFIAIGSAVYSIGVYLFEGKTPEGWTTLMVLVGFGQSCILFLLALLWNQIVELQNGKLSLDSTEEVLIYSPRLK